MSRKRRRSAYSPGGNPVYQQSGAMNLAYYRFFRSQIVKLALARFRWVGLPSTCSERYLEWTLLHQGVATIARPSENTGFVSLQMVQRGEPNMYADPVRWDALGANGTRFACSPESAVLVWDNMERVPIIAMIDSLAWDMSDIVRTKQVNRVHVKTPFILKGPRGMANQMVNYFSQKVGNEPAMIVTDEMSQYVSPDVELMQTGAQYIGDKLNEDLKETWNMVYTFLGIRNLPFKLAQQNSEEVEVYDQPTELQTLGSLQGRRCELDRLSEMVGHEVSVVWNEDFESVNYNVSHNVQSLAQIGYGGQTRDDEGRFA